MPYTHDASRTADPHHPPTLPSPPSAACAERGSGEVHRVSGWWRSYYAFGGWGLKRRTSWGQPQASATLPAQNLAVSSSGTLTRAKPPRNSLVSTYGPSVI